VRRERRSAVAGEAQYAFLHALVRDVAYGLIPRAGRVDKHRLAAEWIASLAGDRSEDRAEMLAHHYLEAISLAEAAGLNTERLRQPAAAALIEATERAGALNAFAAAVGFARKALELLGDADPRRASLLLARGQAGWMLGEADVESLLEARDAFVSRDEIEAAAETETLLSRIFWVRGDRDRSDEHGTRGVALVEDRPLSWTKARVFAQRARMVFLAGDDRDGLELAERARPMVEEVGDDELRSHVLNTIGMARVSLGDPSGIEDLRRSVVLAEAASSPELLHTAYNNLANMLWRLGRLDAATECLTQARVADERFGLSSGLRWLIGEDMLDNALRGRWDVALKLADAVIAAAADDPHYHEGPARMVRAEILLSRGDLNALADSERGLALAREAKDAQTVRPALVYRALVLAGVGRQQEADPLIAEYLRDHDLGGSHQHQLPLLLAELGRGDEYLAALDDEQPTTPWLDAGRAAASGELARAAAIYAEIGAQAAEAQARLLLAEALLAEERRADADFELASALRYFRSVKATAYTSRGEALLAATA
jgi:hypothetical protein